MEIGKCPEHSRRRQGTKKEPSEESSFLQLCFAKRLLTDLGESRGQSLASACRRFGNRGFESNRAAITRGNLDLPAAARSSTIIQVNIRFGLPCVSSSFRRRSACSDCTRISEVSGNTTCTRSGIANERPTTSCVRFCGISLLQLHVGSNIRVEGL